MVVGFRFYLINNNKILKVLSMFVIGVYLFILISIKYMYLFFWLIGV